MKPYSDFFTSRPLGFSRRLIQSRTGLGMHGAKEIRFAAAALRRHGVARSGFKNDFPCR